MGFTRQIELKTAALMQPRTLPSAVVAITCFTCVTLIYSSVYAGCGDYVILTGKIPAHLRAQHKVGEEKASNPFQLGPHSQNLFEDLIPRAPQPCHGPNCGQGRSPEMATTVVPIPTDNQTNLFCTSDSAAAPKDRAGRYEILSQTLRSSDHSQRIDRPPRA